MAYQGVEVALFEKGDFAQGTSSASSKLVHGGLRYLETFDFRLVKEALYERHLLLQNAPHLVRPLSFAIPTYTKVSRPRWKVAAGIYLYKWLSGRYQVGPTKWLSRRQVLLTYDALRDTDLTGCGVYPDAQMDDALLCVETALQAEELGAHIYNYTPVTSITTTTDGCQVTVEQEGELHHIRSRYVINAVGPWLNTFGPEVLGDPTRWIRASKGSHLIIDHQWGPEAFLLQHPKDRRVVFVIPQPDGQTSIVGTTEIVTRRSPDNVQITPGEITYLLEALAYYLPNETIGNAQILQTFSGIRPLINPSKVAAGKVSREHQLIHHSPRVWSLIGGKYTTYRAISEDVARQTMQALGKVWDESKTTTVMPLWGVTRKRPSSLEGDLTFCITHMKVRTMADYERRRTSNWIYS